jgi:hypothetical protein
VGFRDETAQGVETIDQHELGVDFTEAPLERLAGLLEPRERFEGSSPAAHDASGLELGYDVSDVSKLGQPLRRLAVAQPLDAVSPLL